MDLGDFIDTLESSVLPKVVEADRAALVEISKHLTSVAKAKFGVYQPDYGPFKAWKPLSPDTQIIRVKLGYSPDEPLLRTGDTRDSISYQVSDIEAVVGSTEETMIYHELGTKSEPPRPVFGPTAYQSKNKIVELIGKTVVSALINSSNKTKELPDLSDYHMEIT
jgi:phage gpG-like protein